MLRYVLAKFRTLSSLIIHLSHQLKAVFSQSVVPGKRSCTCCSIVLIILSVGFLLATVALIQNQALFSHKSQPGIQRPFSWLSSLDSEVDRKKLRIVFCSYVTSEIPYLLEWIEFHRLQGVDKFVFYHDALPSDPEASALSMQLELLAAFYRDAETRTLNRNTSVGNNDINQGGKDFVDSGLNKLDNDVVEVLPAYTLDPNLWDSLKHVDNISSASYETIQPVLASNCLQRYRDKAEYVMHLDVDEFIYSPQYNTVWDFLEYKKKQQRLTSRILGKTTGFHISSISFGSSGVFWDFHNFLEANYIPGSVLAYYDPRDSSLFRFLEHLNSTSSGEQPREFSSLEFAQQLDAFRLSTLKEVPFFKEIPELAECVHQRLLRDFPPSSSSQPFVDSLSIPQFRSSKSPIFSVFSRILQKPPFSALGDYYASVLSQLEQKPSEGAEDVGHLDRLRRAELHRHYVQRSALFYPLVIEEQINRVRNDKLHETAAKSKAEESFSACTIPTADRKNFLIEKEGFEPDSVALQRALDTYDAVCKGGLGGYFTQLGRTMYATAALDGNPRTRRSGRLRGCHPLDVRACSSWKLDGRVEWADANNDLRIDNHRFRSYEGRLFGLPTWRGGPLGSPSGWNYTIAQQTTGSVVDTSKLRFVPKLRERLSRLRPIPKMFDYVWNSVDENDQIAKFWISRHNITKACSAIELLDEEQVMCPSKYPFAGYVFPFDSEWHSMNPYSWCSDKPTGLDMNPVQDRMDIFSLYPNEDKVDRWVLFQEHAVHCPSYGVAPCCDYDPQLEKYQSPEFMNRPPKMWAPFRTDVEWIFYDALLK